MPSILKLIGLKNRINSLWRFKVLARAKCKLARTLCGVCLLPCKYYTSDKNPQGKVDTVILKEHMNRALYLSRRLSSNEQYIT